MSLVSDTDAARFLIPTEHLEHRLGFSETTNCIRSLSHFRNDFGCWNFLYPKSALNLTAALPMQACCKSRMPHLAKFQEFTGYRRAAIVFFCDNQEA
jgi:hypothetical protein